MPPRSSTTEPFSARTIRSAGTPRFAGEARLRREHAELAVHGHDVPRPQEGEDRADLLGVPVAGDVHGRDLLVQHLRPGLGEAVDRVVHPQLVPRHRLRRDDDRVALLDLHVRVVVVGHPRQRRHRLALAARAEDHRLLGPQELELVGLDQQLVADLEVAEVARDVHVLPQRAADEADLPPGLVGDVHGLLDAVDVGGEGRDEDPALALRE